MEDIEVGKTYTLVHLITRFRNEYNEYGQHIMCKNVIHAEEENIDAWFIFESQDGRHSYYRCIYKG